VIGADFEALRQLSPAWRVQGAWPAARAPGCLVGSALARRAGLAPGVAAVVLVAGAPPARLTVAGIVSTGEAEDDQLFVPLPLLQEMTRLQGRVSLAALSIDGGAVEVSRAAAAISAALPAAAAHPLRRVAAAQGAILEKLGRMMALLTLVVLALSGLCLVTTLMTIVVEREGEIGLMRSIGAGDGEITKMFVGEVSLLGIVGGLTGLALGVGGARLIGSRLFGAAIEPRLGIAPVALSISLVLCLVSILVPLRRALAVQPATALRGE
jgi:putative ABC transport system permease protein